MGPEGREGSVGGGGHTARFRARWLPDSRSGRYKGHISNLVDPNVYTTFSASDGYNDLIFLNVSKVVTVTKGRKPGNGQITCK